MTNEDKKAELIERAAFEAWASGDGYQRDELGCFSHVSPAYFNPHTEQAWRAWQARAALEASPVKPTDALLRHALELAFDHIEMHSLRVSHCKDAAVIDSAMHSIRAGNPVDSLDAETIKKAANYDHLLPYLCKTCGGYGLIDRRSNEGPMDSEPCPNCSQTSGALSAEAIEELYQLGYTFKNGRLVPPDHVGELMVVVQASACGCQYGTCETKANSACRMRAEITQATS